MVLSNMLKIFHDLENKYATEFCKEFVNSSLELRFIFGRNEYAESIAGQINVAGFIDEFTDDKEYMGKPIIRLKDLPPKSLVVSVVIGRPLTVRNKLNKHSAKHLDYFAFYKYSGLEIRPVRYWNDFKDDFETSKGHFQWIYNLLNDATSKETLSKIINFRISDNLDYMDGFVERQDKQYFEDFLNLYPADEVFVDIGGYDGYTSLEFIKRCPDYKSIHFFEPENNNMLLAKNNLAPFKNIIFHPMGLSDRKQTLKFMAGGSTSMVSEFGDIEIHLDKLDDIVNDEVTFIKMDIEGGEGDAIEGAKNCIIKNHPRLAVCVYHKSDDFFKIPEQILSIRDDYTIYLRHYTEGVDETVMFFIPAVSNK